eukprot:855789-Prymnesium_polylepis.1
MLRISKAGARNLGRYEILLRIRIRLAWTKLESNLQSENLNFVPFGMNGQICKKYPKSEKYLTHTVTDQLPSTVLSSAERHVLGCTLLYRGVMLLTRRSQDSALTSPLTALFPPPSEGAHGTACVVAIHTHPTDCMSCSHLHTPLPMYTAEITRVRDRH